MLSIVNFRKEYIFFYIQYFCGIIFLYYPHYLLWILLISRKDIFLYIQYFYWIYLFNLYISILIFIFLLEYLIYLSLCVQWINLTNFRKGYLSYIFIYSTFLFHRHSFIGRELRKFILINIQYFYFREGIDRREKSIVKRIIPLPVTTGSSSTLFRIHQQAWSNDGGDFNTPIRGPSTACEPSTDSRE